MSSLWVRDPVYTSITSRKNVFNPIMKEFDKGFQKIVVAKSLVDDIHVHVSIQA